MSLIGVRLRLARAAFALDVDLQLPAAGISVLFGASGSGKTSLLRCIAGLERARDAFVQVHGQVWQDDASGVFVPTWQRPLGYVFQESSLFEHLDVAANLRYGLRRVGTAEARGMLEGAIDLLGIAHLLRRRPATLSGGERQRVAVARALATQPRLLLLDEPMAALDHARRQDILPWLERLRDELRIPMLYVTHAADEVARLADQLVVLDAGQVRAAGPVAEVLAAIESPVVVGDDAGALLVARVAERDARWHLVRASFEGGSFWVRDGGQAIGQTVRLRVLARDVSLQLQEPTQTSIQNHLPAIVQAIGDGADPSQALVRLSCGRNALLARLTRRAVHALQLAPGMPVWAQVKAVAVIA